MTDAEKNAAIAKWFEPEPESETSPSPLGMWSYVPPPRGLAHEVEGDWEPRHFDIDPDAFVALLEAMAQRNDMALEITVDGGRSIMLVVRDAVYEVINEQAN